MTFGYWVIPLICWFCVWFGVAISDDKDMAGFYLIVAIVPVVLAVVTRCMP